MEGAENALMALGFSDFRVRLFHGAARLQFTPAQWREAAARKDELSSALEPYFDTVLLDFETRTGG